MPSKVNSKLRLKSLLLVAMMLGQGASTLAQTAPAEPTLDVQRYVIDGELPLSTSEVEALLAPYLGPKRSLRDIENAANALERAMRDRGFAFHRMFVPAQRPSGGEVRLQVVKFVLGSVEVAGNSHFSTENIRASLPTLKEGDAPQVQTLGRDITASNANPAKQVSVTFKESRQANTVDAVVKVKDSPPLSFFSILTGNQSLAGNGTASNTYRLTGGVQHSNLFDRDHVATVSYTVDPGDLSAVSLFGAYYQVPLYGTGMNLSASFVNSDVNSGQVVQGAGVFNVSGGGQFTGIRLTKALNRTSALQQTLGISLDERLFKNRTTFGGVPISPDVGSLVLALQYSFRNEPSWGTLAGSLDYAFNVGGGSANTAASHTANGGTKNWDAWRYNLEAVTESSGWQYTGRLKGQYSSKALVSGEQFGLGGANSVRGFPDRVVSGDYGYQWNLEAMGPGLGSLKIRPVFFVDGGWVRARSTLSTETLMGAGAGLRLNYKNLQLAADIAQAIDRNSAEPSGRPVRLNFALSYRF